MKLAVLISGRGSNMQALIDACANPAFPAEIAVVISNNPDAQGLARAAEAGITAMICDHRYFQGDRDAFENALAAIVQQHGAQLVCLAGFMRILSPTFLNQFKDKVVNIHPSLLPAHKGLDTHEKAIAAGDKEHGCSVHVVTAGMDEGPVIAQARVKVLKSDTVETLAARVLEQEHIIYPQVVAEIARGRVIIRQGRIERADAMRHHGDAKVESNIVHEAAMDHHHSSPSPVADPAAVERAQHMWAAFTNATVIAGGAIAVLLVLMATFLV